MIGETLINPILPVTSTIISLYLLVDIFASVTQEFYSDATTQVSLAGVKPNNSIPLGGRWTYIALDL